MPFLQLQMLLLCLLPLILLLPAATSAWVLPPNVNTRPSTKREFVPEIIQGISEISLPILSVTAVNPEEAAVFSDMAGVSEDVTILFAPETTVILRLGAVIGRMLGLISGYAPDQSGHGLALGVPVLITQIYLLTKSTAPIIQAQFIELEELDNLVFDLLFEPVGVNLLQFKGMKATNCFEWVLCEPNTILIDEEEMPGGGVKGNDESWKYLYWQLNGDIIRTFKGKVFGHAKRTGGKDINVQGAQELLGDMRSLSKLEERDNQKMTENRRVDVSSSNSQLHPVCTITIGTKGARMLRIDCDKLFDLMDHDARLESSIRSLLLKSLKLKIVNMLLAVN